MKVKEIQNRLERGYTNSIYGTSENTHEQMTNDIKTLLEVVCNTRCSLTLEDLKVNRFEVIDKVGRAYVNYCNRPLNIETSLQDDDRTLKIFLDD